MAVWVQIYHHKEFLEAQGLDNTNAVRAWPGTPIKLQRGRRDVCRIVGSHDGRQRVLYLKRNLKPYRKHALASLLRHGKRISAAEVEAGSLAALDRLGVPTSPCIAVGGANGLLGERFSFIITEAAPGIPLDEILAAAPRPEEVRRAGAAVMSLVRRIHDAGVGVPTLMGRHIFVDNTQDQPHLCLIDVDRLVRRKRAWRQRVRDLAQLHLSIPLAHLGVRQRIRMLRLYAGDDRAMARRLLRGVARRTNYLLLRRRRRARAFINGLDHQQAERVWRSAERAWRRWTWAAQGANAMSGFAGIALLWLAYALGSRDLFPLDEAEEWSRLAEHMDDAAPALQSMGWLLSSPGVLGLGLVVASLLAARWLSLQQRRS